MNLWKLDSNSIDQNLTLRIMLTIISTAIVMLTFDSYASSVGDPIGGALCNVILIFRGNTARAIALVGIIVLAAQTIRGKLQWEVAMVIIAAIIILFKAPDIVNMIANDNSTTTCGTATIAP